MTNSITESTPEAAKYKYTMLDIETLSTAKNAVVLSIGACAFDENFEIIDKFYVELDTSVQTMRHISIATVKWWLGQKVQPPLDGEVHPSDALFQLREFCKGSYTYWAQGPHFDMTILETLADDFKTYVPWKYWQIRDLRTMEKMFEFEKTINTEAHDALADCVAQLSDLKSLMEMNNFKMEIPKPKKSKPESVIPVHAKCSLSSDESIDGEDDTAATDGDSAATEDTATEDTATEDTATEDTATVDTATVDTATVDTATENVSDIIGAVLDSKST